MKLQFEELININRINASDRNSCMPFMRNEFSKVSEDLCTMTFINGTLMTFLTFKAVIFLRINSILSDSVEVKI